MSERRGGRTNRSAGVGRDGSRLRELAELGALDGHVRAMHNSHEMSNIAPDRGHVIDAPAADWGFSTCPHPDCVLVRLAVPDPLASDTGQGLEPVEERQCGVALHVGFSLECTRTSVHGGRHEAHGSDGRLIGSWSDPASSVPLASSSETQGEPDSAAWWRGVAQKLGVELHDARLAHECSEAVLSMTVDRLGGLVEGQPTHRGNFLQRIDALVTAEASSVPVRASGEPQEEQTR